MDPTVSAACPLSDCPEPRRWVSLLPAACVGRVSAPQGWKGAVAASCQDRAGALIAHSAAAMVHVASEWNKWCLSKCKLQPAPPASSALNGSNQRPPNYSRLQKSDFLFFFFPHGFQGRGEVNESCDSCRRSQQACWGNWCDPERICLDFLSFLPFCLSHHMKAM